MKRWCVIALVLIGVLVAQTSFAQGLSSGDVYRSFKYRMKSDNLVFPDSVIYQLINFGTEVACVHGWAYPKVDTVTLSTGTEQYGLEKLAVWVYRVGGVAQGTPSWQNIPLKDFGKYDIKETPNASFFDFTTEIEGVTTVFTAGGDTSYVYAYPKPTAADNGDSIAIHYFAWADTLDGNVKFSYHDIVLELALMGGHIRKGRSDKAVEAWNKVAPQMTKLRNEWLARIYDIEVVTKEIGGQQ
jgi:hypothetical protein